MAAMAHVWAWSVEAAFSCTAGRVPERQIQRLSTDEARVRVLAAGSQQEPIFCSNEVLLRRPFNGPPDTLKHRGW